MRHKHEGTRAKDVFGKWRVHAGRNVLEKVTFFRYRAYVVARFGAKARALLFNR